MLFHMVDYVSTAVKEVERAVCYTSVALYFPPEAHLYVIQGVMCTS